MHDGDGATLNRNGASSAIEASREELLDLGLRNPLLNHRASRARGVEVVDELPKEVFRILVREQRPMIFGAAPEEGVETEDAGLLVQPGDEDGDGGSAARHMDLWLQTNLTSKELQSRLVKTERDARTFVEEQGVNVLYLALGMLRWFEAGASQGARKAPLVLVPVELERSNVRERFRLRYTEEDLGDNLSLRSKLALEFAVELPGLPAQEDLDLDRYFNEVEEAVGGHLRWSVDRNAVVLGFFSFGKLLMYRDLDGESWPEGCGPSDHPIIRALFDEASHEESERLPEDEHLDRHLDPAKIHQVVDADSSQTLALLDVKGGRNLVIQGPPGTGKSQTITNVIAEAVGEGKTVLFVAEKMAALEVVKRRLDGVGLGDACLELHSRKTNKRMVLQELDRTMRLGAPRLRQAEDDLNALVGARDRLNEYSEAVNTPIGESGATPYRAIGELVRVGPEAANLPRLGVDAMEGWTGSDFRRRLELVKELQAKLARTGVPSQNPFYGSARTVLVPTEQARIGETLRAAHRATRTVRDTAAELAKTLGLPPPGTQPDAESLCRAARRAVEAPRLEGVRLRSEEWRARKDDLRALLTAGEAYSGLRAQYDEALVPEAWDEDLAETRQQLADHADSWWPSLWGDYRRAYNRLQELCKEDVPESLAEQLALVDAVLQTQRHREVIRRLEGLGEDLFGARWKGERSDWRALNGLLGWIVDLHGEVAAGRLPERVVDYLAESPAAEGLERKIADAEGTIVEYGSAVERVAEELELPKDARSSLRGSLLAEQESTFDACDRRLDRLQSLVTYNQLSELCRKEGLEGMLGVAESWPEAGSKLVDAFRRAWFGGLVERAFRERPALARFDRDNHEHVAKRFRELDRLALEHNRVRLAHAHWSGVPKAYEAGGQLGVLRREMEKKRRHLPIRRLMNRAGNAIQALKPVFMMSPLSIANFLEPGAVEFDLVVFDEASQVRPVEALGAIARGRQVVVVGDSKQLPPTSFFDRVVNAEEIDEDNLTADLESVLGLCVAQGVPERMLRWHYRSRHESLIAVSNNEFYANRLVVFPSPDGGREDAGLAYHHLPETVYDRGGARSNLGEAKKVAEAVMEHARERPHLTLGVAAFSAAQAQAIEDQLEMILRRGDTSCEGFFAAHPYEPFFVKNIENVQGDERDAIFVSVGYGRTATGQVPMSFGPLNQDGGERRLNVLITRARRVCRVFTNMTHDDIDLGRTNARGVRALKTFLRYAGGGGMDMPVPTGREPDSPFEEAVLRALEGAGHRVESQVGSAGFFIDLAVVDPEKPGRYLLGIECDGATYHSARSARDRDRLRQEVLEGLGWRIHRIWSTDWFRNPEKELKRAVEAIEEARLLGGTTVPQVEKTANKVSEIVRQSGSGGEKESRVARYEMAKLGRRDVRTCVEVCNGELHSALDVWGSKWIAEVVKAESPIHVREVTRRITEAAGVSRTGSRIQAAVREAMDEAVRDGRVRCSGDFLWLPDMRIPPVRDRSRLPDASKKLEFVATEELAAAVERVVADSYGIERGQVGAAALRLLGFGRTTRAGEEKAERAIQMLLSEGRVAQKGEQLIVEQA